MMQFRLGTEGALESEHIGKPVTIDVFTRHDVTSVMCETHIGVLAGVIEKRGTTRLQDGERMDDFDISAFGGYVVTLIFADGRKVHVGEVDSALVTIHDKEMSA